jgi:hypothetical protein
VFRLNQKAYKILYEEVERCAAQDTLAGEVTRDLALKRLNKLRIQQGKPANAEELNYLLSDILPDLSDKAINKAAKANQPPSPLWIIPKIAIGLTALAGLIWLLNLPYPMIRRPVARTAPIVLLPSYLSMDRHYRQAIAKVEQADQLVNHATSLADLELGEEKVKQAQKHLDALPVWFLGYEPQIFMNWFRFSWLFTLDEFKAARAQVGRMEAKIFQEKNAMAELVTIEANIKQAKQDYQQAASFPAKRQAIAAWQTAIDRISQLPSITLAGKMAATQLRAYERDFRQVSGFVAGNERTNTIIAVAQQFSNKAAQSCQNPPHASFKWQQCVDLWEQAIERLEQVPLADPGYIEAQTLLATYQTNLGEIKIRQALETDSVTAFEQAQTKIESLLGSLPKEENTVNRNQIISQLQNIINQLVTAQ